MKDHNQHEIQMSEAFLNSAFLALSGGFQDAYTYNARNEVFCNAQTGNVVLMSQHFMAGELTAGLGYFFPIIFFALGVWVAEKIQANYKYAQKLHWRQGVLLAEILILFTVGFLPTEYNMLANAMASFACAMQVQSFRKVNGYSYASTMCIGNLRSGTAALSVYFREKKSKQLKQAMYYFGIILMFALGAGIGGNLSIRYGIRMIWVSCGFLMISFLLMFIEKYKHSVIKELASFANGLEKELDAVENAVASELSNGFVEGTNSKVKMVKRTMYGRCGKKLLSAKLMYEL